MNNNTQRYRDTPVMDGYSSSLSSGGEELMGFTFANQSENESQDERRRTGAKTPFEAANNASESENQSDMDIELSNLRLQPDLYRNKIATPRAIRPDSASVASPFSKTTAPLRVGSEETIPSEHSFVPEDGLDAKHYIKSNENLAELVDLDETGDMKKGKSRNLKKPRAMSMKSEDDDLEPRTKKIKVDTEFLKGQQTYYSDRERAEEIYIISSIVQEIASLSVLLQSGSRSDPQMVNELFDGLKINLVDNYAFLYHNEREYLDSIEETLRAFVVDNSETEYADKAQEILDIFFNPDSKEPPMLTGGKRKKTRKSKKSKNKKKTMKNKGGADSNQKPGGIPRPQLRRETREEALRRLDAAHAEIERREEALRRARELLTTNPATPIYNRVRVALFDGLHGPPGNHDTHPPFHYVTVASQQLSSLFLVRGLHEEQISPQRTALQGILEDILTQFEDFITAGDVGGNPTITYNTIQNTIRDSNISRVISILERSGSYPDLQAAQVLREYIYGLIPALDPSNPAHPRPSSIPSSPSSSLRGGKNKKKRRTRKKNKKTTKKRFPIKYLPNKLTKKDRKKQKKELLKSQEDYKKGIYHTREKVKSYDVKPSKYVVQAKKMYDIDNVKPSKELAKKTGCSIKGLNEIVKKGQGAYYSSGSRPNQSGHSWGIARMASVITGNKAAAVDFHIVEKYCDKTKKGYKTALKGKKKHGRGTRKVRKVS